MTISEEAKLGRTECECMNALQDYGIISDNCVWWTDVGNQDVALAWLKANPPAGVLL